MPEAVGYVRVSTEGQAQKGVSLEAQEAKIRAWCKANHYSMLALHTDAGLSGSRSDNRPGLQAALEALDRAADAGECELYTSQVTAEEIAPYKGETKPAIEQVYQATPKVPYTERQTFLGIHSYGDRYTWINAPMIKDNPEWLRIRALGLTDKDAHHVMLASQAGCNVLLTCDRGLLHRAEVICQHQRVRVMKPTVLCKEKGWN